MFAPYYYAHGSSLGFFSIVSEMRGPKQYTPAMLTCIAQSTMYINNVTISRYTYLDSPLLRIIMATQKPSEMSRPSPRNDVSVSHSFLWDQDSLPTLGACRMPPSRAKSNALCYIYVGLQQYQYLFL
jgi:hypothetical protein